MPVFERVFVQGGSRGIGLGLVHHFLSQHSTQTLWVSCRHPAESDTLQSLKQQHEERLQLVAMDLENETSVRAACEQITEQASSLNAIFNCSGFLHDADTAPEKRLKDLGYTPFLRAMQVNAIGPTTVCQALLPLFAKQPGGVIVNISARVGSIDDNRLGGWHSYRASKAAQNMLTRCLAIEVARKQFHPICFAYHPGTVDTDLSAPFQSQVKEGKLFSVEQAVDYLMTQVEGASEKTHGAFIDWQGKPVPF